MSADNIKVAIKARPVLKKEKDINVCWKISSNSIQQVENQADPFFFDHIFDQTASNQDIFNTVVKPIVNSCMEGINGTIFVYGQTSSGKTYTMLGDEENPGVINLAVNEIFNFIQNSLDRLFLLRVGYIEIYNEKIYDLLNKDNKNLKIHEITNGEVTVNCSEFIVTSEADILRYLQTGNKLRKCGETNMNERSSRSHAIFKLTVESREVKKNQVQEIDAEHFQISSLNLVDLAGSERADQTGATGFRLKEGSHINKSLLSLGCVIKSLSENAESDSYINFRNSKLTRILQASLGGNALTAIICNIKLTTIDETNSTLNFAMRAKTIKNKPQVNEVISDAAMMRILEKKVSKLQCELELEKKKNSKLKILELEKQIKYETHKIVNSHFLKSTQFDHNRRRTWCPSSINNDTTPNTQKHLQCESKRSLKHDTKKSVSKIPNFFTPLITCRSEDYENDNEGDDLFKESPVSISSILSETINDHINYCETPNVHKNEKSFDYSTSPDLKQKYKILEKQFKELEIFTNLENKIGVNHEVVKSLTSQIEACHIELSNKDKKIQDLLITNLNSDLIIEKFRYEIENKDNHIEKLQKSLHTKDKELELESREKISIQFEFEQLKLKSRVREEELLDLIREKDDRLLKAEKIRMNKEILQMNNCKINNNICRIHNSFANIFKINQNDNIKLEKICKKLISKHLLVEQNVMNLEADLQKANLDCKHKKMKLDEVEERFEKSKQAHQLEVNKHDLVKNKFRSINDENTNLKLAVGKNNNLIDIMKQECLSLKRVTSILTENMKKLKKQQCVILKKTSGDINKLYLENKTIYQEFHNLKEVLHQKDRKIVKCENVIQKFLLNIPSLKNQLSQIGAFIKNETILMSEKFQILKKLIHSFFDNKSKIFLLENTPCNIECPSTNLVNNTFFEEFYKGNGSCQHRILDKQSSDLQSMYNKMKQDLESLKNENEDLSEKIVDAVTNLDILTIENNQVKALNRSLNEQINKLKVDFNLKISKTQNFKNFEELENLNKKYINEIQEIKDKKKNLELELQEIKNKIVSNKYSIDAKEMRIKNLTSECEDSQRKILEIEAKNASDLKIIGVQNENYLEKLNKKHEEECNSLNKQLQSLQNTLRNMQNLQKQVSDLEMKNDNISKQFLEIQDENLKLQHEINETKNFKDENKNLKKEISETKFLLTQYQIDIEASKANNLVQSKTEEEYKKIIEMLKNEISQLQIKNVALKDEIETKAQRQSENWRKLKRQSCHDETRSIFSEPFKDSFTMTDPTNEICNCNTFAEKISELKKLLLIRDSQIIALNLKINNNVMVDEIQKLKKELFDKETENKKLFEDIIALKERLSQQCQKYSENLRQVVCEEKSERKKLNQDLLEMKSQLKEQANIYKEKLEKILYEKEKALQEIADLKQNTCSLKEQKVQAEESKENDLTHLQEINQDLRTLCRYRHAKISALKEEIQKLKKQLETVN